MKNKPIIKSKGKVLIPTLIFFGLGSISLYVSIIVLRDALFLPKIDIAGLISGLSFLFFPILLFTLILKFDTIYIYKDKVIIKSILGYTKRTILLKDIISWKENIMLTIYTEKGKYSILQYYDNYSQIKQALIKKKPQEEQKKLNIWNKKLFTAFSIFLFIMGIILLYNSYDTYQNKQHPIYPSELITLSDIVTNNPEVKKMKSGKAQITVGYSTTINLKNYPDYSFHIQRNSSKEAEMRKLINSVYFGDSVNVDISKVDYESMKEEKSIFNFLFPKKSIIIYGIKKENIAYFNLMDYYKEYPSKTGKDFTGSLIFGLLFFFGGILIIVKQIKK